MASTRRKLAALGVAGVLTAGATITALTPAVAQDATESPSADAEAGGREARHAEREAAFAAALADELDLPVERVSTALENVRAEMKAQGKERHLAAMKERLDAAVADGRLTQEQADAIYAAAESGAMPFGGRGGRGGHRHGPHGGGGDGPAETGTEVEGTAA